MDDNTESIVYRHGIIITPQHDDPARRTAADRPPDYAEASALDRTAAIAASCQEASCPVLPSFPVSVS